MSSAFEFSSDNLAHFQEVLSRYPTKRAAMLPTLHLAQKQQGYITPEIEQYVSQLLEVPVVDVREVLTFYSLYHRRPMGRRHIRLCMSISCWIRGAEKIKTCLREETGVSSGEITENGAISWEAVPDCLGACELAPMMQVGGVYHGHLKAEGLGSILEKMSGHSQNQKGSS